MRSIDRSRKKVFLVLSNGAPSSFAGSQCSPYRFVTSWQNDQQAEVVGAYANDMGYKRMVLMARNFQGGRDYVSGFKRQYKGAVIEEIFTSLNQMDLAMTIAMQPKLLLLDEPMAGMSHHESRVMAKLLNRLKQRYTTLLVEHDMDIVFALANRITVLVYGKVLVCGTSL